MLRKILVVDDDSDVVKLLKSKLEATDRFIVVGAIGGRVAVAMAQSQPPDLVLCDVDMPDLDGGQVASALAGSSATKDVPIIFLSALVASKEIDDGAKSGRWPVMPKDCSMEALIKRIDESLTTAASSRP